MNFKVISRVKDRYTLKATERAGVYLVNIPPALTVALS